MSIRYVFSERFKVENISEDYFCEKTECSVGGLVATMQRQIGLLCSQLLFDDEISYINIRIKVDGKETEYSSSESKGILTAEIQEAVSNLLKADKIEVDLDYDYVWRVWKDYLSIGPFMMTGILEECDDRIFDFVDYAMFNQADCSDGAGVISVYGKRNGCIHRGVVDYSVVKEIPYFGNWYEPQTLTIIEDEDICIPEENIPRVTELCRELVKMCSASCNDDYSVEGNVLYLILSQPDLDTPEKTKKFIYNISELATLINCPPDKSQDDIFYIAEFFDIADTAPNLLKIEINYRGEVKISMARAF